MAADQDRTQLLFTNVSRSLDKMVNKRTPENVHGFRTSSRRLESFLRFLVPGQNRKLLKQLGRWRRRAGTLRDTDVQLSALQSLKVPENSGRKSQLVTLLLDTRAKRERKLLRTFDEDRTRRFQKRLKRAAADVRGLDKKIPDPLTLARSMFEELTREHPTMIEETVHEYRLQCKRIRYIAEISVAPEAKAFIAGLVRIQDVTGAWRDWEMLKDSAENQMQDTPRSGLLAALRNVSQAKFKEAARVCSESRDSLLSETASAASMSLSAAPPPKPVKSIRVKIASAASA
jgi:CHAD domain-containing protein